MSIEDIAARAVDRAAATLLARARDQVPPDVRVVAAGNGAGNGADNGIVVSGRRLRERAMRDARLREIGK